MSKHTPGPWIGRRTRVYDAIYADDVLVAFVGIREDEEALANASLISAAPDLLEALTAVSRLDYLQEHNALAAIVRDAITKATS